MGKVTTVNITTLMLSDEAGATAATAQTYALTATTTYARASDGTAALIDLKTGDR